MKQDPEEQAILEWLRRVDKPLTTKDKKKGQDKRKAKSGNG